MSPPTCEKIARAVSLGSTDQLREAIDQGELVRDFELGDRCSVIIEMIRACIDRELPIPRVSEMLNFDADPNAVGWFGFSPLQYILMRGHMDAQTLAANVVSLLCAGADVNKLLPTQMDVSGWSGHYREFISYPLALAIQSGSLPAVEAILLGGAQLDGPGGVDVITPLSVAAMWKENSIISLLLRRGANPRIANEDGSLAIHHCWDEECGAILYDFGSPLSIPDCNQRLPMHEWVERATESCAIEWIASKCPEDRFKKDGKGQSPYELLQKRVMEDSSNTSWLTPIFVKWEADLIDSSTQVASGNDQGRRL